MWKKLVKRPHCVKSLETFVNGNFQDSTSDLLQTDTIGFKTEMPGCNKKTVELKLRLSYDLQVLAPRLFQGIETIVKCYEVRTGQLNQIMPKVFDIMHTVKPPSKQNETGVTLFWLRKRMKYIRFQPCIQSMGFNVGNTEKIKAKETQLGSYGNYVFIPGQCKAQNITLRYIFKDKTYSYSHIISIKKFPNLCESKNQIIQNNNDNQAIKFFTANDYQNTYIIASSTGGTAILAITIAIISCMVKRSRRIREDEETTGEDLNPVYGTYYEGEGEYSTVNDPNTLYDREGGEDNHNIVRDNNSNYGNT